MSSASSSTPLLTPEFLTKLEQLELVSRKIFQGKMKGERRSKKKGQSVEFADHRNYVVGDDLRFLDWNLFARLDRLFLRLFMEEEDLHIYILVDHSLSMDFGNPTKLQYAKQIAAALGFVGLVNMDRVAVSAFSSNVTRSVSSLRGKRMLWRLVDFLQNVDAEGAGDLRQSMKTFTLTCPGKGVVVLLSDFMDKGGYEEALRYLIARQLDVYVIQILSKEELHPELMGDLKLVDIEDDDFAEITVNAPLIKKYKENLAVYQQTLRDYCAQRGIAFLFTNNEIPFDEVILKYLRQRGLVR